MMHHAACSMHTSFGRVEPKGASHIFFVHGVSCYTDEHSRCKTPVGGERQGKIIPVDVRELRKEEFRVCVSLSLIPRTSV